MSLENKETLLQYYSINQFSKEYIDSFLHPEKYFSKYSLLLAMSEDIIRETGELCNIIDKEKETLI